MKAQPLQSIGLSLRQAPFERSRAVRSDDVEPKLPWRLALPLIGGVSLGLWALIGWAITSLF